MFNALITIAIRLRFDYDPTTTYRARLLPIRRKQKMNMSVLLFCSGNIGGIGYQFNWYLVTRRSSALLPPGLRRCQRCGGPRSGGSADASRRSRCDTPDHRRLPRLCGVPLSLRRRTGTSSRPATHHRQLTGTNDLLAAIS